MEKHMSSYPSSRQSYQLLFTFFPEKQCLSPAKNFNPSIVHDEKSPRRSALRTETSVNFPPENSLCPSEWQSDNLFTDGNYVIM